MQKRRWLWTTAVVAAVGVLGAACNDNKTPTDAQHVHTTSTVSLSQTAVTMKTGDRVSLSAQPLCSEGTIVPTTVS